VKCFPTFTALRGERTRYAISIDNGTPAFVTVGNGLGGGNALGENARWLVDVRRSYTLGETFYQSSENKNITIRIYFAEPGLVLSGLSVVYPAENDLTRLITNPDFEITEGMRLDGSVYRGDPFGWTRTGELNGQSWGVNADAANYHGKYVCWYNSTPMPSAFQLSQTINNYLPENIFCAVVLYSCYWRITTQRLLPQLSPYYGRNRYQKQHTPSEINTFAGYAVDPGNGSGINLKKCN
jgi:hypothetical protein